MDVILIILTIVVSILLLGFNIYALIYYLDPSEKGFADSWFCKVIAVTGLMLAWAQVLTLPLDVSNTEGSGGDLDLDIMWQIIYMLVFIYLVVLLPSTMFYYESDEDDRACQRICYTIKHMVFVVVISAIILGIMYGVLGFTSIPVLSYDCTYTEIASDSSDTSTNCTETEVELELDVTFPIYVMGLLAFMGWFLLVVFGGIGLSAIPLDLINAFRFRPKKKSASELAATERALKDKAAELLRVGQQTKELQEELKLESGWFGKRRIKNSIRMAMNRLQAESLVLEHDYDIFIQEKDFGGIKPWLYPLYLILGILCAVVSFLWVLHILLYVVIRSDGVPAHPFLNNLLIDLENPSVSFLGTILYCFLASYLLLAVFKGNIKFGLRFFFCFRAHPVKKDGTPMNSVLFNLMLILLASVAVTLFCTNAFSMYARLSDINNMFGIQVRYLAFFRYFYEYNVFEIMLMSWALLAALYLALKNRDQPATKSRIDLEFEREKAKLDRI